MSKDTVICRSKLVPFNPTFVSGKKKNNFEVFLPVKGKAIFFHRLFILLDRELEIFFCKHLQRKQT